jgi:hypothetical protein
MQRHSPTHLLETARGGLLVLGLFLLAAGLPACADDTPPAEERGSLGKADIFGSCGGVGSDLCGGPGEGSCWCDDDCAEYLDCCPDKSSTCDGVSCEGPDPSEVCSDCIPSACTCSDGTWQCTPDCSGTCEDTVTCEGPDPSTVCSDCIPSACDCIDGTWQCTPDCSGTCS